MYSATVAQDVYAELMAKGYDVASAEDVVSGEVTIELVLTKEQAGR